MFDLTAKRFTDKDAARKHLEAVRWPDGPICPHCGSVNNANRIKGKSARPGLWFCADCRTQFTVTVGTVFERSKVPLHKWLLAVHLLSASKKGMSAHQMHRMLGVTYKTAWFMMHRIREAMIVDGSDPLGGNGKIVEADETYFGSQANPEPSPARKGKPYKSKKLAARKRAVVSLVERGGNVRTFHVTGNVNASAVREILVRNVSRDTTLHTDESNLYPKTGREFAKHETIKHTAGEYVRNKTIHTNTVEGYFSIFKRGMKGVYQHCGEQHLQRYLTEFDFRYSNRVGLGVSDMDRAVLAVKGAKKVTRKPRALKIKAIKARYKRAAWLARIGKRHSSDL
jgi:transposase-like protein